MMKLSDYQTLFRASPYPYLVMAPGLTIIGASGAYLRQSSVLRKKSSADPVEALRFR